jgi:class 3 adenylate cyclase
LEELNAMPAKTLDRGPLASHGSGEGTLDGFRPSLPLEPGCLGATADPLAEYRQRLAHDDRALADPTAERLLQIETFVSGILPVEPDRALAAILFTDIVGSTERASTLGDRRWRTLLETHDTVAHTVVQRHWGRLIKMTGDGMLATFDRPGTAIRCAIAFGEAVRPLGLEIRAGLHTGEVEVRESDIAGIGVHIAARVLSSSSPGEVWVSAVVPMLVSGSGFEFDDRGDHELKGVPGSWKLFSVRDGGPLLSASSDHTCERRTPLVSEEPHWWRGDLNLRPSGYEKESLIPYKSAPSVKSSSPAV